MNDETLTQLDTISHHMLRIGTMISGFIAAAKGQGGGAFVSDL
ncbi:hypothetical protein [Rhizobium leguminosarum]|nr:hypothetical protein [Rhizobium leguminosarum]